MSRIKTRKKRETKFESNWLSKSIESLEKDSWNLPEFESDMVTRCYQLRKIQLKDFQIEDLRLMISQEIGLTFLIPLALERLNENILEEGDYYEGDLLKAVLTADIEYWKIEKENWSKMQIIFEDNREKLENEAAEYDPGREIIKAYKEFKKINISVHNKI